MNKLKELNYTDIEKNDKPRVAIIPWGSIEPHGEHLPYLTDSILAEAVANAVTSEAQSRDNDVFYVTLPIFSLGSQNPGQTNMHFCIHFNVETQKQVLNDIVHSLWLQGVQDIYIINGHNGNDFKGIIRDLAEEYPIIGVHWCNYLDVVKEYVDSSEAKENGVVSYELDDHAAYTETSLMLHVNPELVHLENLNNTGWDGEGNHGYFWTPRNWLMCSVNTRVGTVGMASGKVGKKMFDYVVKVLSDEIVESQH